MDAVREYLCPGDSYAISPAVHRARLAAGYASCRECPFRIDHPEGDGTARSAGNRLDRLMTDDGIRGVARNAIDASNAGRLAAALAMEFWEDAERAGTLPPPG